jgi:hypothetical protein
MRSREIRGERITVSKEKVTPKPDGAPSKSIDAAEGAKAMEQLNAVESPQDVVPDGFDLSKVQSINAAREEAAIPEHKKASAIIGRPTVFVSWRPQKALLASSGREHAGFFCVCIDVETGRPFTIWIGQTALYKELSRLKPPFRATIALKVVGKTPEGEEKKLLQFT